MTADIPTERSRADGSEHAERCEACGGETPHDVRIEIRTEGRGGENVAFSREPYRVATCRECGTTTRTRMNNA